MKRVEVKRRLIRLGNVKRKALRFGDSTKECVLNTELSDDQRSLWANSQTLVYPYREGPVEVYMLRNHIRYSQGIFFVSPQRSLNGSFALTSDRGAWFAVSDANESQLINYSHWVSWEHSKMLHIPFPHSMRVNIWVHLQYSNYTSTQDANNVRRIIDGTFDFEDWFFNSFFLLAL